MCSVCEYKYCFFGLLIIPALCVVSFFGGYINLSFLFLSSFPIICISLIKNSCIISEICEKVKKSGKIELAVFCDCAGFNNIKIGRLKTFSSSLYIQNCKIEFLDCQNLHTLSLINSTVKNFINPEYIEEFYLTNSAQESIPKLENAKTIRITYCPNITEISDYPSLENLSCKNTSIKYIKNLRNLKNLFCDTCKKLVYVWNCPSLVYSDISDSNLLYFCSGSRNLNFSNLDSPYLIMHEEDQSTLFTERENKMKKVANFLRNRRTLLKIKRFFSSGIIDEYYKNKFRPDSIYSKKIIERLKNNAKFLSN